MTKSRTLLALLLALLPTHAGATALPPPGVAACSGCHAKSGGDPAMPQLAGRSASEIVAAMDAFRAGKRPATVMDRIAKGFTDDEIAAIAAWYAAQK
jgi:cytochrome subunit of sulfide dehydrogenase